MTANGERVPWAWNDMTHKEELCANKEACMWFLGWLAIALGTAFVAASKNRGGGKWLLLGLLLGPIALIIVGFSAPLPPTEDTAVQRGTRLCPFCAEEIKRQAMVCKHCGKDVPAFEIPQNNNPVATAYYELQHRFDQRLTQGEAKLELEKMGFSPVEICDFLDSL